MAPLMIPPKYASMAGSEDKRPSQISAPEERQRQ